MAIINVLRGLDASDIVAADPFDLYHDAGDEARAIPDLVKVSLGTDKRREDGDPEPVPGERRGWWGDTFAEEHGGTGPDDGIGSKLWLLFRTQRTAANINLAVQYARDALAWMTTKGVAAGIEVSAVDGQGDVTLEIVIVRDADPPIVLRYADFWEGLANG